jgi:threonine synthase
LRRSRGAAISVSDAELTDAVQEIGTTEGVFAAPEGAACLPALKRLLTQEVIKRDERVVLFNTGSGVKYLDLWRK